MDLGKSLLLFILCCGFPFGSLGAEDAGPAVAKDFSIQPSSEWVEWPANFQNVVASYGKKSTLATFYVTVRDLEEAKTVRDLKWEDLFKPQYASIDIHNQGETVIGGEKSRYCLYSLKPGEFKTTMEGKLPAKYMNYILVHGNRLFSITFKDTEEGFSLNYPSFVTVIRTLRFEAVPSGKQGGAAS